jgi:hypothetical protein
LTTADQIGTWLVPQSQFAIEYSVAALSKIDRAAGDALVALRGGLGIGGVLLGTRDPRGVKILAFRPAECEYALGPVFALSDHDRRRLAEQLRDIRQDPGLKGMEVVGWYVSHTRRGVMLAESDLEIYSTFFPESWQVALVVRPSIMASTVAGFFFREPEGLVRSASSYLEFTLETGPGSGEIPEPVIPSAPPDPPAIRLGGAWTRSLGLEMRAPEEYFAAEPPVQGPPEQPPTDAAVLALAPEPVLLEQPAAPPLSESGDPTPSVRLTEPARASNVFARTIWVWLAGVVLLAAVAGWTFMRWLPSRDSGPVALHLKAAERNGLLEIRWESAALPARRVQGGAISITDGTATESFSLDAPQVMSGSVLYPRHSDSVDIHMTVKLTGGTTTEGYLTFAAAGTQDAVAESNGAQDQKELATEAERAQQELSQAEARNQQLEKALKAVQEAQPGAGAAPSNRDRPGRGGVPAAGAAAQVARPVSAGGSGAAANRQQAAPVVTPPERNLSPPAAAGRPAGSEPEKPALSSGSSTVPVTAAPASAQVPRPQAPAQPATNGVAQPPTRDGLAANEVLKVPQPHEASAPPPAPVQRASPPAPSVAGRWAYSEAFPSGSPFPPKSATLSITQGNDQVTGTFTGLYRVPKGRKFKADVQLRFAGPARSGSQKFTFTASDGSTGEIEILTVAGKPNEVEVVWHSARDGLTFDDVLFRAQ